MVADGGNGRHIIFDIMHAGQQDLIRCHNAMPRPGLGAVNDAVFQEDAVFHRTAAGEPGDSARRAGRKAAGDRIVGIQDDAVRRALVQEDVFLGVDILLHVLMDIQMVRREIRHDCHMCAVGEIHQLERAQLHDGEVLRLHLLGVLQQRRADIAPQPDLAPGLL